MKQTTSRTIVRLCAYCKQPYAPYYGSLFHGISKYCSGACRNRARTRTLSERLLARCVVDAASGCWLWTGPLTPKGYGRINVNNVVVLAHRASASAWNGFDLASTLAVCHACDVPRCINPKHLFVGSIADNNRDMRTKRRHAHGSKHHNAKLTEVAVKEIRARYAAGELPPALAREYGVGRKAIRFAVRRITWKHVP